MDESGGGESKVRDLRSGRGKQAAQQEQAAAEAQAADLAAQRAAFMGPKMTLEFANEYMFDLWRSGIVTDGKRMIANTIGNTIHAKTPVEYAALAQELTLLTGAPVDNPIANQNTIRRFLGMPEVQAS